MITTNYLRRVVLLFLSWNLFNGSHIYATGSSVLWADSLSSSGDEYAQRCVTDSAGNLYVTGFSNGPTLFNYTNNGDYDIFTAKIAKNGTLLWGKYFGTTFRDQSFTIILDNEENPIISGFSYGTWDVTNKGGSDILIIKFDKDTGDIIFDRSFGGPRDDFSYGIAVDPSDNSIIASGFTAGNITTQINFGLEDSFIIKYLASGAFQWIQVFGTNGSDKANGLLVDPEGHIFVTGSISDGVFDQAFGDRDGFLAKFDNTGSMLWVHQFGTNDSDTFYSVDFDSAHNVVACGQVRGPFFNSQWGGQADAGCIEYDQGGTMIWAVSVGGTGWDSAWTVDINRTTTTLQPGSPAADSIFVAAYTDGYFYQSNGANDIMLLRFNSEGKLQWVDLIGSTANDQASGVAFDSSTGNLYAVGYFGAAIPGVLNYTAGVDAYVMLVGPPFTTDFGSTSGNSGKDKSVDTAVVVGAVLGSILGLIVLLGIGGFAFYYMRKQSNLKMMAVFNSEDPQGSIGALSTTSLPSVATHGSLSPDKKKNSKDITWEIDYGELNLEKKIGQGSSGIVYRAKWRKTEVACKQLLINKASDRDIQNFRDEAELMRNLRPNKNVLLYYGVCTDPLNPLCIVTEFVQNGNLWNLLQNSAFQWTNALKLKIIKGVASGMYHLTKEKIVHRDLAARNILLTETFEAKISDFGLSRVVENEDDSNQTSTNVGPIRWMSPESIMQRIYSEKSDVWSFAVLVYEVLTQTQPYAGTSQLQVATSIGNRQLRLNYPKDVPVISDLLEKCMNWEPDNRPRFEQIIETLEHVTVNDKDQFVATK